MRPLAAIGRSAPDSGEVGDPKLRDPVVEAGNGPSAASAWNRPVERISQLGTEQELCRALGAVSNPERGLPRQPSIQIAWIIHIIHR